MATCSRDVCCQRPGGSHSAAAPRPSADTATSEADDARKWWRATVAKNVGSAAVPIFLAHGTSDPVVPLARGAAARDQLSQLGYQVEWHEYPMQHSVCREEVEQMAAFLARVLTR